MRLFLIRHAQSANNALPEHQRVEDPEITPLGHQQAAALGNWLAGAELHHVITSPFRRSLQTTEYIRRQVPLVPHVWVDLHEQGGCYAGHQPANYLGRPGLGRTQIQREFPGYEVESGLGEEGWWGCRPYEEDESARERARRLLQRAMTTFGESGASIAFVMHADFKRLFLAELLGRLDPSSGPGHGIFNTAVSIVEFKRGKPRLHTYNSTAHLGPELLSS